ncbi:MAG: DciA family protein [Treponema sp.]
MKEIKKFSNLLDDYISTLTAQMQSKKKNINVYNYWETILEKENLSSNSYLDDFKNDTLFIRVEHPGIAQQIRIKTNKIINDFKNAFPDLNIRKINIIVDAVFDINENVPCGTFRKEV